MRFSITKIIMYVTLVLFAIAWLIPFYSTVLASLKSNEDLAAKPFWSLPEKIVLWDNIVKTWKRAYMGKYFFNSLLYAPVASISAVFIASLAAFPLARLKIKGRRALFFLFLCGMFIPYQMYVVPLFLMSVQLKIYDTLVGLILIYTSLCIPFCVFLLRNYFMTIPSDLFDAARIDGASHFGIYWRIFLPLAKPALVTAFITQFMWVWNDLLFGLVLTASVNTRPVMVGLSMLEGYYEFQWALLATGGLITIIPPLLIFISLRKHFIKGISMGIAKA